MYSDSTIDLNVLQLSWRMMIGFTLYNPSAMPLSLTFFSPPFHVLHLT